MEDFLPIIFLLTPFCALLLFLFFSTKDKWDKSQEILSYLDLNDYKKFENLRIRSVSKRAWKTIWGFEVNGVMLINDINIIILPAKRSLILFHTHLPSLIKRNSKIRPKIKFQTFNQISIKHFNQATVEYVLKTKNSKQKEEIIESLKK